MSPDHVCEMYREPFLSRRMRGLLSVPRVAPSFSQTYLRMKRTNEEREVGGVGEPDQPAGRLSPLHVGCLPGGANALSHDRSVTDTFGSGLGQSLATSGRKPPPRASTKEEAKGFLLKRLNDYA